MIHALILQPKIVIGQQPNVVKDKYKINTMQNDEKIEFSRRMNSVADILGIPPKGNNRQSLLGKMFHVSQESARKWLEGESIPQTAKCIEIAKKAKISFEWLMTGRGVQPYEKTPEAQVLLAMQHMDEATKYQVVKISDSLAEPEPKPNGHNPPKATGT